MTSRVLTTGTDVRRELLDRLASVRELRGPAWVDFTAEIREVVLIASSSRGGSSMVSEILRRSGHLLHLRGEINPFLRLVGLGYPDSGTGSDRLDAGHLAALEPAARDLLNAELARDVGRMTDTVDDGRYVLDVAWRIAVQWPDLPMDLAAVADIALSVLRRLRARHRWADGEVRDIGLYFRSLLADLAGHGLPVDPRYYDLPGDRDGWAAAPAAPAAPAATGRAPGRTLVEEPPFVLTVPWRGVDRRHPPDRPLVIKTPANAYRPEFLRALFPRARFRVLHLTRNPAAAVSGLYDGWRYDGFHACRMPEALEIGGYVEKAEENRWWWKFDLPPAWQEFTRAPLFDVCAFQWRSAHQAVLADLARGGTDSLRMRFEDLISGPESRIASFERLSAWLGIPLDGAFRRAVYEGIGPVVATVRPRPGRWRARAAPIERALGPRELEVADRLGYGDRTEWI
ncbi:hypothetical protein GCM10010191_11320 [Actinomadura vinacea]|uniref:Sulfotransferase n=1 Tax=Actinomadura vinacea TaxID=115336 RepID=A0ABN3IJI8_9ACTN